jgi:ferredoxin, 2Fe-2S
VATEIKIKVKDRKGIVHELEAPTNMAMNIMEICKAYDLPIDGVCGGIAMCASCQCYILSSDIELPHMNPDEEAMLSEAFYVKNNSRLGCQIPITPNLDGLEIELAPETA